MKQTLFEWEWKLLTTRFPMTTVARKKGTQTLEATHIQSHIDSIHSPQRTRNTIMKLCMKSMKFHRGIVFKGKRSTLSGIWLEKWYIGELNKWVWFTCVALPEELHAHDSKYEDDDTEDEGEVTKSTNSFPHDGDQKVECWPRLCQFKHSELGGIMPLTLRIKPPVICGD